jgi:diaminohydroxyphosphoribosylaminopyrimidine deaminase/5-amino-6-(5-phosphoribosylamino)uracil reductase
MMNEAEALNRGFLKRMRTGFPWIQLKLGASLDGRTAMASGESQWITSAAARRDVQRLRAQSSAILSTSATVLADNPSLTVRWSELNEEVRAQLDESQLRQPVRVVIDSQQRVTPQHRLIDQPGETWLMRSEPDQHAWPASVTQIAVPQRGEQLDLVAMMMLLGQRQINSVWVEAGAGLAGALLQAGLVDELIVYMAPKLLGNAARGLCTLPGLEPLADAPALNFSDVRLVGEDLRLTLTPR